MESKQKSSLPNAEPVTNCDRSIIPIRIESLIHIIREQQVMLDSDLARLYGVETKVLNQAVKRNIQRFPEDFMFQLTKDECLRSQIVTLNGSRGGTRYMPYLIALLCWLGRTKLRGAAGWLRPWFMRFRSVLKADYFTATFFAVPP